MQRRRILPYLTLTAFFLAIGTGGAVPGRASEVPPNNVVGHDLVLSLALDPSNGDVIGAGVTSGSAASNNAGNTDALLTRYSVDGELIWIRQWGTNISDTATGVAVGQGGDAYVTGVSTDNDGTTLAWIRRYDETGSLLGAEATITVPGLPNASVFPQDITVSPSGTLYLAGYLTQSSGAQNAWLAAYSTTGTRLWFKTISSGSNDAAYAIAATRTQVYVVGDTFGSVTGRRGTNAGDRDAWVARYSIQGVQKWIRQAGSKGADTPTALTLVSSSGTGGGNTSQGTSVYVVGNTSGDLYKTSAGGQDVFIVGFDSSGKELWAHQKGTSEHDTPVAIDTDRELLTVIGKSNTSGGPHTSWAVDLTLNGRPKKGVEHQLPDGAEVRDAFVDSEGTFFLGGDAVGGQDVPGSSDTDAFIARFIGGDLEWLDMFGSTEPISGDVMAYTVDMVGDLVRHIVPPADTSPQIQDWLSDHYVLVDPKQSIGDNLMILLPGSGAQPKAFQLYLQFVASQGYATIGLRYPNSWTIGSLCEKLQPVPDTVGDDCYAQVREEILTGKDTTDLVDVSEPESISARLVALLQFMQGKDPATNWARWLDGGQPRWDSIMVSGHSQGGGHAAFIGKMFEVPRVIMLSSPEDIYKNGTSAPWVSAAGVTPASAYFGFDQIKDQGWSKNKQNWSLLGIDAFGPLTEISNAQPPFDHSHRLVSNVPPSSGSDSGMDAHDSTATDGETPLLSDGSALYANDGVWGYLCCP